jgi:hypothetical protein
VCKRDKRKKMKGSRSDSSKPNYVEYTKQRAEAKARQAWYKNSQVIRRYKKELKQTEGHILVKNESVGEVNESAGDRNKEQNRSSSSSSSSALPSERSQQRDESESKIDSEERKAKNNNKKKAKIDPFAKERKIADKVKEKKEAEINRINDAEKERMKKIKAREVKRKKFGQRDSKGRPLIKNTISNILEKLQKK